MADIMYICIALVSLFLISDLNISISFRSLSSGWTIFHTLDANIVMNFVSKVWNTVPLEPKDFNDLSDDNF